MGYTHYLKRPLYIDSWDKIIKEFQEAMDIIKGLGVDICSPTGEPGTSPEINKHIIHFCGSTRQKANQFTTDKHFGIVWNEEYDTRKFSLTDETVCESCNITREYNFAFIPEPDEYGNFYTFCKTRRYPYDLAVMAVYLIVKHNDSRCKIMSDGEIQEWQIPIGIVAEVCGIHRNTVLSYLTEEKIFRL